MIHCDANVATCKLYVYYLHSIYNFLNCGWGRSRSQNRRRDEGLLPNRRSTPGWRHSVVTMRLHGSTSSNVALHCFKNKRGVGKSSLGWILSSWSSPAVLPLLHNELMAMYTFTFAIALLLSTDVVEGWPLPLSTGIEVHNERTVSSQLRDPARIPHPVVRRIDIDTPSSTPAVASTISEIIQRSAPVIDVNAKNQSNVSVHTFCTVHPSSNLLRFL